MPPLPHFGVRGDGPRVEGGEGGPDAPGRLGMRRLSRAAHAEEGPRWNRKVTGSAGGGAGPSRLVPSSRPWGSARLSHGCLSSPWWADPAHVHEPTVKRVLSHAVPLNAAGPWAASSEDAAGPARCRRSVCGLTTHPPSDRSWTRVPTVAPRPCASHGKGPQPLARGVCPSPGPLTCTQQTFVHR